MLLYLFLGTPIHYWKDKNKNYFKVSKTMENQDYEMTRNPLWKYSRNSYISLIYLPQNSLMFWKEISKFIKVQNIQLKSESSTNCYWKFQKCKDTNLRPSTQNRRKDKCSLGTIMRGVTIPGLLHAGSFSICKL